AIDRVLTCYPFTKPLLVRSNNPNNPLDGAKIITRQEPKFKSSRSNGGKISIQKASDLKKIFENIEDPLATHKTEKTKSAVKSENKESDEIEDGQIMETVVKCDNNGKRKVEEVEESVIDNNKKKQKLDKTEGGAEIPEELT
ncbi:23561_t:CDS:2, partial [Dentiscutata erythropus]